MNKYRCETGPVCLEQADAVAAGWEKLGVRTTLLTEEYGSVVVPRMRDRTQPWPVVKNCSVETANYPFDWPPPPSDSTFSRPAWGCSFESKYLDYMFININGERERAPREALHQRKREVPAPTSRTRRRSGRSRAGLCPCFAPQPLRQRFLCRSWPPLVGNRVSR